MWARERAVCCWRLTHSSSFMCFSALRYRHVTLRHPPPSVKFLHLHTKRKEARDSATRCPWRAGGQPNNTLARHRSCASWDIRPYPRGTRSERHYHSPYAVQRDLGFPCELSLWVISDERCDRAGRVASSSSRMANFPVATTRRLSTLVPRALLACSTLFLGRIAAQRRH